MEAHAMDSLNTDQMIAKLRQLQPHRVRVYQDADNYKDVAVPQRRKRWAQVVAAIESLAWSRCELLDKSGAILGMIENAATELESLESSGGGGGGGGVMRERWLIEAVIKAQQVALTYRDKEHTTLLQCVKEVLQINMQSMRELHQIMSMQRNEAIEEMERVRAAADQGSDMDQIVKLIEASPKLMQTLGPVLVALFGGGRKKIAAPPPNGKVS
jgi:hypothetical protein